ncbi:MAG: helix-turn-helix domain-containing protein [Mediterraneibacter gnavus]
MTLKERIKSLADAEGISLPVLESKLGFGNSTIVKWDKSTPNAEKLNKVAQYFNVTMDYLLNGDSFDDDSDLNNRDKKVMTTYDVISELCKNGIWLLQH